MSKPIFYDPDRKRWKRLRRVFDVVAVVSTIVLIAFGINVIRRENLPELLLPVQKRNYHALKEYGRAKPPVHARRRNHRGRPSEIPLNSGVGLRAAYYVDYDPASYSSLKQHIHQIDLLFTDWIHIITPDGRPMAFTLDNHPYAVVDSAGVHNVDQGGKVMKAITDAKEDTDIFPMVSNYNPLTGDFSSKVVEQFLKSPQAQTTFTTQMLEFLDANPRYRGLSMDLEALPTDTQPLYHQLIANLYEQMHAKNLRLYINVPVDDDDWDFKFYAAHSDGLILMNYDQHEPGSLPGPVAAQDWFVRNLQAALKVVPKNKLICAIGNYGYDWTMSLPKTVHHRTMPSKVLSVQDMAVQDAWQAASDSEATPVLDPDSLNMHFAYDDDDAHVRHQIWYLDGVTAVNQMRAARDLGIETFALWRLGSEDRSMWKIWDKPVESDAPKLLATIPPGEDVNTDGQGDILRIIGVPQLGKRFIQEDPETHLLIAQQIQTFPEPYTVEQYGYHRHEVALTFDDGPDPTWTPKILDILKEKNVKATFMVIGEEAQDNIGLLKRYYREGHEIGNHTFTHPDISEISNRQVDLELNLTERLFAAELGVQPLYFRPPYSIDQEPDTNDEAAPAYRIQKMGYIIIGDKIDTDDWNEHPRKTPQEIIDNVFAQLHTMETKPQLGSGPGSIILLHDGGGDRSVTVETLPLLIDALRAHGYKIVPVSALMGKTRAEVMPPISPKQRWQARVDAIAFFFISFFNRTVIVFFFVGDVLMTGRLIIVGIFAAIDRFRRRKLPPGAENYRPQIAVLIPAYNEEKVIARTIRSVLHSDYPFLRVIVIDDGSTDGTYEAARAAMPAELASGKLTVLTKQNGGKAEALNYGLEHVQEEVYVGIDADTVIAPDAISHLIVRMADPRVGAIAGNAKVGNRVNLWTRWQALEYITSQNFERRALDLFNVVTVVPGAIGAWRTQPVKDGGGYHVNTVAEDADLTMNLLQQGYKVIYEDRALAFTEAPANVRGLMRQRFRWSFGTLQAVFKHRAAFVKHRAMGLFALPNIIIFQMLMPVFSPLIDLMFAAGVVHYFVDRHFHPETASNASFEKLVAYFLAFLIVDFLASSLAFALEPRHPANKGDGWLLWHIWIQRFTYRQVFSLVLVKTIKRAIDGRPFNWEKQDRTAKLSANTEIATTGR
ncbi:MAG TPA: glycosyltransferase [Acidobacteriaceae bacterium]|jgi:cellulose synthase/poly-beta-1,6-N-acetylglucosamine synthase-like glycosyltransferase/peptidoglycan/xylan/chitin deacetylase (PgdA/CDA1 family)/spore germination protein YaaH|nr:glycosyltransferase [Acidobacteriaceae bacterium]